MSTSSSTRATRGVAIQLRIEGVFREARLLDPETGETLATNLEGDVLTVTLEGARAAVLWVTRPDLN